MKRSFKMPLSKSENTAVRLDARIPVHIKENLILAAALSGRTQTDILVAAVNEAAQKIIAEHNLISLCLEDQKILAKALLDENDPQDDQRWSVLRKAFQRHAQEAESR
jgi:uncharacterized protein (DUF1778 family)